jgi:hypothetical protein
MVRFFMKLIWNDTEPVAPLPPIEAAPEIIEENFEDDYGEEGLDDEA